MRRILIVLPLLLCAFALADEPTCPTNYGYSGYLAQSQWQHVEGWHCADAMQSPISIAPPYTPERNKSITVNYPQSMSPKVENSGHDFRVIPTVQSSID